MTGAPLSPRRGAASCTPHGRAERQNGRGGKESHEMSRKKKGALVVITRKDKRLNKGWELNT
jgi:hypothetical protein